MNVPPTKSPGQISHGIGSRDAGHPSEVQQPGIGPQQVEIIKTVAALEDHLEKRQDLGRDGISPLSAFQMPEAPVQLLGQTDVLGKGHEQG